MPAGDPSAVGSARVMRYEEERVEIDTDAPGARLLVLTDTDYPGWRAFVDGREVAVRRANFAFRAVAVPAGTHRVVFVYAPDSVRCGAQLSGLALVIVLGVVVMTRTVARPTPAMCRRRRRADHERWARPSRTRRMVSAASRDV